MATLGANIRAERARLGLTQESLARKVGVARGTIVLWECGATTPSIAKIKMIAQVLGLKDMNRLIEV